MQNKISYFTMLKFLTFAVVTLSINGVDAKVVPAKKAAAKTTRTAAPHARDLAEWTIVAYVQADNNLAPYATYNINDMQVGMKSADQVNMLVEWDQPNNNKTWRYRIVPGNRIEDGSLSTEMGIDPVGEIVAAMQWAQTNYPAKKYGLILWNHGSGVEDFKNPLAKTQRLIHSWIQIPGAAVLSPGQRGILYDDSQGTCLTNQGLTSALTQIKTNLGKNLDFLGMDACLMAMLEVGYQVKDCVNYFVGSQQTEPGNGWAYSNWLTPLTTNPSSFGGLELSQAIVAAYGQFYQNEKDAQDYTQSAVQTSAIDGIKQNINQFIANVAACKVADATQTKAMIKAARKQATEFYMPEYIDLYSFYAALGNRLGKNAAKSERILNAARPAAKSVNKNFLAACATLKQTVSAGMKLISSAVVANASGPDYPNVKGVSIYYPTTGSIHASYPLTQFAQDSAWLGFLKEYRK